MNLFRYRLHHDFGLAPNPFWGVMTLAVCKEGIRRSRNLKIGDWVIGCGSCQLHNLGSLIYVMKVQEILTFDEYWNDSRFEIKKPRLNGSLMVMYGDNFVKPPENFLPIATPAPRGFSYKGLSKNLEKNFIDWLTSSFEPGIYGEPISWKEYFPHHK